MFSLINSNIIGDISYIKATILLLIFSLSHCYMSHFLYFLAFIGIIYYCCYFLLYVIIFIILFHIIIGAKIYIVNLLKSNISNTSNHGRNLEHLTPFTHFYVAVYMCQYMYFEYPMALFLLSYKSLSIWTYPHIYPFYYSPFFFTPLCSIKDNFPSTRTNPIQIFFLVQGIVMKSSLIIFYNASICLHFLTA